mmetsp:Transcript_15585/g.33756  ORF Transcript_15585/g.33756 Transcript_15585/m.33756 type:complete len:96 (-) Transcript_15585:304-591(-)
MSTTLEGRVRTPIGGGGARNLSYMLEMTASLAMTAGQVLGSLWRQRRSHAITVATAHQQRKMMLWLLFGCGKMDVPLFISLTNDLINFSVTWNQQ